MHVTLRHGLYRDGTSYRTAVMRPITGLAEAALADQPSQAPLASRVTVLLASTTECIGPFTPTRDDLRALTVGDRERLLAAALDATVGPGIEAVARCTSPACGALMDLEFDLRDLLSPCDGDIGGGHSREFDMPFADGSTRGRLWFRLPTGADLESVASLAREKAGRAADALLARCVIGARSETGADLSSVELGEAARRALGDEFRRLDPDSGIAVTASCPACGTPVHALVDLGAFLVALLGPGGEIFTDVHRLACAYHWSEADILALPVPRRRRYLAELAGGLEPA
jgi:hypothetical protein